MIRKIKWCISPKLAKLLVRVPCVSVAWVDSTMSKLEIKSTKERPSPVSESSVPCDTVFPRRWAALASSPAAGAAPSELVPPSSAPLRRRKDRNERRLAYVTTGTTSPPVAPRPNSPSSTALPDGTAPCKSAPCLRPDLRQESLRKSEELFFRPSGFAAGTVATDASGEDASGVPSGGFVGSALAPALASISSLACRLMASIREATVLGVDIREEAEATELFEARRGLISLLPRRDAVRCAAAAEQEQNKKSDCGRP